MLWVWPQKAKNKQTNKNRTVDLEEKKKMEKMEERRKVEEKMT